MNFRPLHDRICVEPVEQESKSAGGVIIPDTAKEKPMHGNVLAVGPGHKNEDGQVVPVDDLIIGLMAEPVLDLGGIAALDFL